MQSQLTQFNLDNVNFFYSPWPFFAPYLYWKTLARQGNFLHFQYIFPVKKMYEKEDFHLLHKAHKSNSAAKKDQNASPKFFWRSPEKFRVFLTLEIDNFLQRGVIESSTAKVLSPRRHKITSWFVLLLSLWGIESTSQVLVKTKK